MEIAVPPPQAETEPVPGQLDFSSRPRSVSLLSCSADGINKESPDIKRKRQEQPTHRSCPSIPDMKAIYPEPVLPVIPDRSLLHAIPSTLLLDILNKKYSTPFDEVIIIDCRYPYEYEGGHIEGAINLPSLKDIEERFPVDPEMCADNKLFLFHCEFSSKRGPAGINHLRALDRNANLTRYPKTSYPHIYLLHGGYKNFFEMSKGEHCTPASYRMMKDPEFEKELNAWESLSNRRRIWKKQKSRSDPCLPTRSGDLRL